MRNLVLTVVCLLCAVFIVSPRANAQTGKISGQVTEAVSGEPLPGVNVVLVGEQIGATTDQNGNYSILNVSSGTYSLRASFVGFATETVQEVEVSIDLTTTVNFQLQEQTEQLQEVTVQAQERVVRPDISANVSNLKAEDFQNLPRTSVEDVIQLQAGIRGGLRVRGSGSGEVNLVVDGMTMRTGRTNQPFTGISYTGVKEVKVQTGGFNAEYGNVRSGLVNIVTKDPPRSGYTVDALFRYTPAQKKHFGISPNNPESFYMRPIVGECAFVGTDSEECGWDRYTREQYREFQGFNAVSNKLEGDDDPNNDLTPEQAQEVTLWHFRRDPGVSKPDMTVDATIGGPVPGISQYLGDLRFLASYRQHQEAYTIPEVREVYKNHYFSGKLYSDLGSGLRLRLDGMYNVETGINASDHGFPSMVRNEHGAINRFLGGTNPESSTRTIFTLGSTTHSGPAPSRITRDMLGLELTHTLSSNTFYTFRLRRETEDYETPTSWPVRDTSTVLKRVGPWELTEEPFGYWGPSKLSFTGLIRLGHYNTAEDSSTVSGWGGSFDLTHQATSYAQFKTGVDFNYQKFDVGHCNCDPYFPPQSQHYSWSAPPKQGAAYVQSKLEFQGLVANLGVRLDAYDPGRQWWNYGRYDKAFGPRVGKDQFEEFVDQAPTETQFSVSPRIGVSFPITTESKLFFNYGHFRQMLDPQELFLIQSAVTGKVEEVGNPNHPMPKTVSYELGFEQQLFRNVLVRISGYAKALELQPRTVRYTDIRRRASYQVRQPNNYEYIRGFETTLRKQAGWLQGFLNYTFSVRKEGNYGFAQYFENPVDMREFARTSNAHRQFRPVPQPYARVNLAVVSPPEFGPEILGRHLLQDWRLSWLGSWRAGDYFTWTGGASLPGIQNNVQWKDSWGLDLRIAKNVSFEAADIKLFADVSNVLNLKQMHPNTAFVGRFDYENYMRSLHLPRDAFEEIDTKPYAFVPGDDQPGDYRDWDVEFVPIEVVGSTEKVGEPHERPLYYTENNKDYMTWTGSSWEKADDGRVEEVLDKKAYIDMPNERSYTFLNPRRVRFGIQLSF